MKPNLLLALLALFLAGCATSTIESRKKERYEAYSSLTDAQRTAVDAGQLVIGLPMEGVYIAWGKPDQVVSGESQAGAFTSWLYSDSYLQGVSYWGYRPYHAGYYRYPYYGPTLMHDYVPVGYIRAEVVFENGLVKQWRTLPAPGY